MRPILLALVILLRAYYLTVDEKDKNGWVFPVTGEIVYKQSFAWYVGEFSTICTLSILSIFRDKKWMISTKVFTGITVCDFADFLLTGNSVWWHWGIIPICMNTISIVIFDVAAFCEAIHYALKRFHETGS